MTSFLPFSTQKRFRGRSCQVYSFRDTEKDFIRKRCRLQRATKLLSQILKTIGFWPPKIKSSFFNITAKKSKKFFWISKKRNICDSSYCLLFTYQIWDRYLFFRQAIAKKLFKIDDVKFSNSILSNSRLCSAKQRLPLDSPWQDKSNQYQFYVKLSTLKLDLFWPDLDLTSNRKWPKPYLMVL